MDKRAIPEEQRHVGAKIAHARRASGLTQRALAAELGVTTRTVINYEAGVTIPYKHFQRIEELTHVRRDWLLQGSGPPDFGETFDRLERAMQNHRTLVETQVEIVATRLELLRDHGDATR